jgi:hypothetical protein
MWHMPAVQNAGTLHAAGCRGCIADSKRAGKHAGGADAMGLGCAICQSREAQRTNLASISQGLRLPVMKVRFSALLMAGERAKANPKWSASFDVLAMQRIGGHKLLLDTAERSAAMHAEKTSSILQKAVSGFYALDAISKKN